LKSIKRVYKASCDLRIIIVNNGFRETGDDLAGIIIPDSKSGFKIINTDRNRGYAGGVNIGITEALKEKKTDYVLILNNDTILPENLFTKLLKDDHDIVAPVIKFKYRGDWRFDYGGRIDKWFGRTKHIEKNKLISKKPDNDGEDIDYVSGCCMLVSRRVFERIGLYDSKFFFYFEDVDFCIRASNAGFRIEVLTDTTVFHKLSSAIGRWSDKAILYNLTGNALFILKHFGFKIPVGLGYLFLLSIKIIVNRIRKR
jgi:GT2 family glycosyltransferase